MSALLPEVSALEEVLLRLMREIRPASPAKPVRFTSHPLLAALRRAGTRHLYVDTADPQELHEVLRAAEDEGSVTYYEEVDGNTTNQPLVEKVFDRLLETQGVEAIRAWVQELRAAHPRLTVEEAVVAAYSLLNLHLAAAVVGRFGAGRGWHISLELHTGLAGDREGSVRFGRCLGRSVPGALVKVAFTPHEPHAFLIARDLERQGIAVNFTATFSARQVVAAALLANPHRTNIFLGRLNEGLRAQVLGEHVLLTSQRHLRDLRARCGLRTLNMGASVRRPETLVLTAGCDAYTAPAPVLRSFLTQPESEIRDRTEEDLSGALGVDPEVVERVGGMDRIARLYRVEPEFVAFLLQLREDPELDRMDGDALAERFERAGFGDLFYRPSPEEWRELRKSKLPDLNAPYVRRIPLDTLYSLLALGDFANFQDRMDARIREALRGSFG
ncbi:MAG: transaldolase family protein [Armatimonadota bacterium]|nr:transaldolase family protein [Armatimonadota bacterium]MDR7445375.1 transaldolase family protein [Armatimonadota bacterium]MDR7569738.1 transaldolase family protein [Armatimonadota bacterium]MDR7614108.1 transaldolase family protein [Armatimonadota bacterium]